MATTKPKTSKKETAERTSKQPSKSNSEIPSKSAAKSASKSTLDCTAKKNVKKTPSKTSSPKSTAKFSTPKAAPSAANTSNEPQNNIPTKKRATLITQLKERLTQERDTLLIGMKRKESGTELSTHGDLVDQSTTFSEHEILLGLAEHDRNRLQEINRALDKIEKGTYGICEMSGSLISDERLLAMPTARYSVECQAKIEGYG